MARVSVDSECLSDTRFVRLARALNIADPDTARMKCVRVWHECTLRGRSELTAEDVDMASGIDGFALAMVGVELAKLRAGGRIYCSGSRGRIEWFQQRGKAASKGGKATRKKWNELTQANEMQQIGAGRAGTPKVPTGARPSPLLSSPLLPEEKKEKDLQASPAAFALDLSEPSTSAVTQLRRAFAPWYAAAYGQEYAWCARDGKQAKSALQKAGDGGVEEVMRRVAAMASEGWRKSPVTIATVDGSWNAAPKTAAKPERDSLWDAMDAEDRARGIVP